MRKLAVMMAALVLAGACAGPLPGPAGGAAPVASAPAMADMDRLVNGARRGAGLAPVVSMAALDAAAQRQASDLAAAGGVSHVGAGGSRLSDRLRASGVRACVAAENVAFNGGGAEAVMARWTSSPLHRANLLNPKVTGYGLGRSGDHWVLVLAQPC